MLARIESDCLMSKDAFIRLAVLESKISRGEKPEKIQNDIRNIQRWTIALQKLECFLHRVKTFVKKVQHSSFVGQCLLKIIQKVQQLQHYESKLLAKFLCQNHKYIKPSDLEQLLGSLLSQIDPETVEVNQQFWNICIQFVKLTIVEKDFNTVLEKCCKKLNNMLKNYELTKQTLCERIYSTLYLTLAKFYCIGSIKCINENDRINNLNKCENIFKEIFQLNSRSCKRQINLLLSEVKNKKGITQYGCKLRKLTNFDHFSRKFENWRNSIIFPQLIFNSKHKNMPIEQFEDSKKYKKQQDFSQLQQININNSFQKTICKIDKVYDIKVDNFVSDQKQFEKSTPQIALNKSPKSSQSIEEQKNQGPDHFFPENESLMKKSQTNFRQTAQQFFQELGDLLLQNQEVLNLEQIPKIIKQNLQQNNGYVQQKQSLHQLSCLSADLKRSIPRISLKQIITVEANTVQTCSKENRYSEKIVDQFIQLSNTDMCNRLIQQQDQLAQQVNLFISDAIIEIFSQYCDSIQRYLFQNHEQIEPKLEKLEEITQQILQSSRQLEPKQLSQIIQECFYLCMKKIIQNLFKNNSSKIQETETKQFKEKEKLKQVLIELKSTFMEVKLNENITISYELELHQKEGVVIGRKHAKQIIFMIPINKTQNLKWIREVISNKQNYFELENLFVSNLWVKWPQSNVNIIVQHRDIYPLRVQIYEYFENEKNFSILIDLYSLPKHQIFRSVQNTVKEQKKDEKSQSSLQKRCRNQLPQYIGNMRINKIETKYYKKVKQWTCLHVNTNGQIFIGQPDISQSQIIQLLL